MTVDRSRNSQVSDTVGETGAATPRSPLLQLATDFLRLGTLGLRRPRRAVRSDGARAGGREGLSVLLGKIAIGDVLTAPLALISLVLLFRFKISNPMLIASAAIVGLTAFPILHPTWVMLK